MSNNSNGSPANYTPSTADQLYALRSAQLAELELIDNIQFAVYGILIPMVCVPGMLANVASFIVFTRPKMRSSINVYLAGLSVFDFFVLFLSFFIYPPLAFAQRFRSHAAMQMFNISVLAVYPLSLIAQFGSVYTCVAITLDRFLAVRYPLRIRGICTVQRAVGVLAAISVTGVCFRLPTLFEVRMTADGRITPTALRQNKTYQLLYTAVAYILVLYAIPFFIMVILNGFLAKSLHVAHRKRLKMAAPTSSKTNQQQQAALPINNMKGRDRRKSSGGNKGSSGVLDRDRKVNVMAMAIIMSFLLLNTPAFLNNVLETLFSEEQARRVYVRSMIFTGNFCICLNSAANLIIYCSLGARFRAMFVSIFFPYCRDSFSQDRLRRNNFCPVSGTGTGTGTGTGPGGEFRFSNILNIDGIHGPASSSCYIDRNSTNGPSNQSFASNRHVRWSNSSTLKHSPANSNADGKTILHKNSNNSQAAPDGTDDHHGNRSETFNKGVAINISNNNQNQQQQSKTTASSISFGHRCEVRVIDPSKPRPAFKLSLSKTTATKAFNQHHSWNR